MHYAYYITNRYYPKESVHNDGKNDASQVANTFPK